MYREFLMRNTGMSSVCRFLLEGYIFMSKFRYSLHTTVPIRYFCDLSDIIHRICLKIGIVSSQWVLQSVNENCRSTSRYFRRLALKDQTLNRSSSKFRFYMEYLLRLFCLQIYRFSVDSAFFHTFSITRTSFYKVFLNERALF